jgi:pimeloyl-ACP methyl ester carboxylesterase
MSINTAYSQREAKAMTLTYPVAAAPSNLGSLVIALHSSGATGRQWQNLTQALGPTFRVVSPDLIGCGDNPHWNGEKPFELTDEARPIVEIIDAWKGPVHLVGHSYGGGVALRVAVERPDRIASLSLYEPTAFHVLKANGEDGQAALEEIRTLAAEIGRHVVNGAYRAAARRFVDYWNGAGTFGALKPDVQSNIVRYITKACLDFRALIDERTPLVAYRRLRVPLRLMIGQYAPVATELVARKLAMVMNLGALRVVVGAGHMGPMSHSDVVAKMIIEHIAASDPSAAPYGSPPTQQVPSLNPARRAGADLRRVAAAA